MAATGPRINEFRTHVEAWTSDRGQALGIAAALVTAGIAFEFNGFSTEETHFWFRAEKQHAHLFRAHLGVPAGYPR
jgi:hypothetical protein